MKKFLNIYDLQDQGITFSSALHLWKGLGIADLLEVSLSEHLRESTKVFGMHTINRAYIDEVVAGQVRVNYNQNPHHMAALAGMQRSVVVAAACVRKYSHLVAAEHEYHQNTGQPSTLFIMPVVSRTVSCRAENCRSVSI